MRFRIQVCDEGCPKRSWWEDYDKEDVEDARQWAEETVAGFNSSLRPFESPRELLDVEILED